MCTPWDLGSVDFLETLALDAIDLEIAQGELFALLGGSGCGKTTLLRMLAGFEAPTSGRILIDGQDMAGIPPYERPVNMMFQSYALFPHMTVEANVGYGLKHEAMTAEQRRAHRAELNAAVNEKLASNTQDYWIGKLNAAGVPTG